MPSVPVVPKVSKNSFSFKKVAFKHAPKAPIAPKAKLSFRAPKTPFAPLVKRPAPVRAVKPTRNVPLKKKVSPVPRAPVVRVPPKRLF